MYVWVLTVHGVIQTWTKWHHNLQESTKKELWVSPLTFSLKVTGMLIFCTNLPCWWSDLGVMLKISVKSRKGRSKETATYHYSSGGAVKTSVATCVLQPLQKTHSLALTRKSWTWRCTAKDSYINDTTMAVWTVYATWGIATRLCELTELCEGCVECTELLKALCSVELLSICTCS